MVSKNNTDIRDVTAVGIVEWDRAFGESLRMAVNSTPDTCCIGVWASAENSLGQIQSRRPFIVLVDVDSPGASGIETTALLKRSMPDVHVMIVSAEADHETLAAAIKAGACGYLIKPSPVGGRLKPDSSDRALTVAAMARRVIGVLREQSPEKIKPGHRSIPLSRQESMVARLISEGLMNKEIADRMELSNHTVHSHLKSIFKKLKVHSRTEVAVVYLKLLDERTG